MRIWSLHPKYLDVKGLIALWRETLLAKNVLEGKTRGYLNHPQLDRFKRAGEPLEAINYYLYIVWFEADLRSYNFNISKFIPVEDVKRIEVTTEQIKYEKGHLLDKLKIRDKILYNDISVIDDFDTHPLFRTVIGDIEPWERI